MNGYGEGGFMTDGPAAGVDEKKPGFVRQQIHLLPVTCKQINCAEQEGEKFLIDGQELSHITLIGQMRQCVVQSNCIIVTVDDGTGLVEVRHWIDPSSPGAEKVKEICGSNNYLRIYGNMRDFKGKKDVLAQRIQVVEDFSELTFHMLQCIATHLANTRGPLTPSVHTAYRVDDNISDVGVAYPSNLHHAVHEIVKREKKQDGKDIHEIYSELAGIATEAKIKEAVDWLVEIGIFYYGIDKDHLNCS